MYCVFVNTSNGYSAIQDVPYFYTSKNSLFSSNGVLNTNQSSTQDSSPVNLLGVLLGTGLAALVVIVAIAVVVVAMVYRRHHRGVRNAHVSVGVAMDTEKTRLIFQQ